MPRLKSTSVSEVGIGPECGAVRAQESHMNSSLPSPSTFLTTALVASFMLQISHFMVALPFPTPCGRNARKKLKDVHYAIMGA